MLISILLSADLSLRGFLYDGGFSYDGGKPIKYRSTSYENAQKDTDRQTTDLKSARLNFPNSTMQPFILQNASGDLQFPKSALSY